MDLEIAKDLRAAAAYLRAHGWCQDRVRDETGAVCLVGAFQSVGIHDYVLTKQALGFESGRFDMIDWNNEPSRTIGEVLDRLESTALGLEVRALAAEPRLVPEEVHA